MDDIFNELFDLIDKESLKELLKNGQNYCTVENKCYENDKLVSDHKKTWKNNKLIEDIERCANSENKCVNCNDCKKNCDNKCECKVEDKLLADNQFLMRIKKELENKLNEKTAAYDALKARYDAQETTMKKLAEKFTELNEKLYKVSEIFKS